jgi:2-dehydropantoate 2-reductase
MVRRLVGDEAIPAEPLKTVHIVGLGAVGTVMGIALVRAGVEVHTYRGNGPDVRTLRVSYHDRVETVGVRHHARALPNVRGRDAVLIAVKWPHLRSALSLIAPRLTRDNPLLLPQNGLVDIELASVAARHHVAPVVVHVAARSVRRGVIVVHTGPKFLVPHSLTVLGRVPLEREGFSFLHARNLAVAQRLKVLVACTSAPMALRGVSIGEAFGDVQLRRELVAVAQEAATVLIAHGRGDRRLKQDADLLIGRMTEGSIVDPATMRSAYTSLHEDLNVRHLATEARWLNGLIVRLGRRLGIPTPINASLLSRVRQTERGRPLSRLRGNG